MGFGFEKSHLKTEKQLLEKKIARERREKRRLVRKSLLERERRCGNCSFFKENGFEEEISTRNYRGEKIKLGEGFCLNEKQRFSKRRGYLAVSRVAGCQYFNPRYFYVFMKIAMEKQL